MKLNFSNAMTTEKADSYQDQLDTLTQKWEAAVKELGKVRLKLINSRPAILMKSRQGIPAKDDNGANIILKASNREERDAIVEFLLGPLVAQEEQLDLEIKYYEGASRNVRQALSTEQSKMSASRTIAEAMTVKQL